MIASGSRSGAVRAIGRQDYGTAVQSSRTARVAPGFAGEHGSARGRSASPVALLVPFLAAVAILVAAGVAGRCLVALLLLLALAVGLFAVGLFAVGLFAVGLFAVGLFTVGLFTVGLFTIGLLASLAVGLVAL